MSNPQNEESVHPIVIPNLRARPEDALILACSRLALDESSTARVRALLGGPLDWNYILGVAEAHGISSLLFFNLFDMFREEIPASALDRLKENHHAGMQQSLMLASELLRLLDAFEAHGIRAVPLKGPVLAVMAYGDLSLRRFGDLDILVREQDVLRVKDLLIEQGYQASLSLPKWQEDLFHQTYYEHSFERCDGLFYVELHYQVVPHHFSFDLEPESLFERTGSISVARREIDSLSPEDTLLYLCAHGAKHCWARLSWICDVTELIRSQRLDWDVAQERARELGAERMLFLGLLLAHNLHNAPVPEPILHRIQADQTTKCLADQVTGKFFQSSVVEPGLFERMLFHLRARERWLDRARYCLRLLTNTSAADWDLIRLPKSLYFIYSLIRPFRLVQTYGLSSLKRRFAGDASS